ncbi:MoaD/ThiS family protein [Leptospira meyeri]|uniref:MoaD/ThiS family protein n=1 Tax=Leptospira meyeri TaxID=29508 RepID=UPI0002BF95D7|nr:MoaD/ThiS family protein [Leptospira meyeri]EMJ88259.1 ThiS family protein [Leptospira meyeri serovar Semaranga str. Veldrot Semarang 173]TGM63233.1 molybdopterin synthase sulfur carrier subunit [Leptospira meyeri]TGM70334.1 molybdopterin synthase sulfur carrier subunit [Leptospira meyeri]
MKIQLLSFAALKDFFPPKQELTIDGIRTVLDLKKHLQNQKPEASHLIKVSRISINQTIANDSDSITEGSTVAILPPSSGG